mmetsp:Transcript_1986/g.6343  ORF Transcript_1986/g.6343 Transcript_1986/m.6343 type:complete len:350 (+) Transcript_1986:1449-2498(+)
MRNAHERAATSCWKPASCAAHTPPSPATGSVKTLGYGVTHELPTRRSISTPSPAEYDEGFSDATGGSERSSPPNTNSTSSASLADSTVGVVKNSPLEGLLSSATHSMLSRPDRASSTFSRSLGFTSASMFVVVRSTHMVMALSRGPSGRQASAASKRATWSAGQSGSQQQFVSHASAVRSHVHVQSNVSHALASPSKHVQPSGVAASVGVASDLASTRSKSTGSVGRLDACAGAATNAQATATSAAAAADIGAAVSRRAISLHSRRCRHRTPAQCLPASPHCGSPGARNERARRGGRCGWRHPTTCSSLAGNGPAAAPTHALSPALRPTPALPRATSPVSTATRPPARP